MVVEPEPYTYTPRSSKSFAIEILTLVYQMRAQMWKEEPQWPWSENHGLPGFLVIDNNATMLVMRSFALAQLLESKSL